MALVNLSLRNYRCFAERQDVELRPITVVLGKNNSGKSALVRAPLILQTGIRNDHPLPFDLEQFGDDAPEFTDLVHGRLDLSSVTIGLGLTGPGGEEYTLDATVQNVPELYSQRVLEWSLTSGGRRASYTWVSGRTDEELEQQVYRRPDRSTVSMDFKGLLPTELPDGDGTGWFAPERVRSSFDVIHHLGPFRFKPKRLVRLPAREPDHDEFGSRTAEILAYDHVRRKGRLINKINEYLRTALPAWELKVQPHLDGYAVGLRSLETKDLWVPATDIGTGISQILPFLVRRAQDELDPPERDVLEVVEEPELHLHPSAQAMLADLYIRAIDVASVRFLVETHSEAFLLRLRRRVAEGELDAKRLALYFVDDGGEFSTVRRINVDELGNVDYWPEGIFEEGFEEVRALAEAQETRLESDAG
ncbi:DUF3696 domain-containing protein [Actinomadura oligospora]|uniref:DUF3696 domain-containing protein n=1 Tax=Actinomadura oligospora TaxID=111804 RepID=UPI00047D19C5|nr:DUF3696 domain-containing protein [Actinomadura oligospora]